jgi:hypothetical protein
VAQGEGPEFKPQYHTHTHTHTHTDIQDIPTRAYKPDPGHIPQQVNFRNARSV